MRNCMSLLSKLKEQPLILLATVGISAATIGFAGGMSINRTTSSVVNQSQATTSENQNGATDQAPGSFDPNQMPSGKGQGGAGQGMPPGRGGQGMTPPDATSGASQSDSTTTDENSSSSDEVNALKQRNQEIKSQIESDSSSTEE